MKYSILFTILFCSILHVNAEGLPIDSNGNLVAPFISVTLTDSQLAKLEYSRIIELTESQQKLVSNIWKFESINIFDSNYSDCTCGEYGAIWYKPNQIAFIGDTSSSQKPWYWENTESELIFSEAPSTDNSVFIGIAGDLYFQGTKTSLNSLINTYKTVVKLDYILVYLPPKKENPSWEKIMVLKNEMNKAKGKLKIIYL